MLELNKINVFIGQTEIISDISLNVAEGEKVGIIGPNGHGKSTTLLTILGIYSPRKGEVKFEGNKINGLSSKEIVERGISLVPEGGHLFPEMTVFENLMLGAYTKKARADLEGNLKRVYRLFPKVEILQKSKCNSLSGGELRMVAVGRGMMSSPKLLILDEPTLGLQPNLVGEMGRTLNEIGKAGKSIILADENIDLVAEFADRVYFIENGKIGLSGPTGEVLRNEYVKKVYLGIE